MPMAMRLSLLAIQHLRQCLWHDPTDPKQGKHKWIQVHCQGTLQQKVIQRHSIYVAWVLP